MMNKLTLFHTLRSLAALSYRFPAGFSAARGETGNWCDNSRASHVNASAAPATVSENKAAFRHCACIAWEGAASVARSLASPETGLLA
jgi:hypothetical protein